MAIPPGTSATRQTSGQLCAASSRQECITVHGAKWRVIITGMRIRSGLGARSMADANFLAAALLGYEQRKIVLTVPDQYPGIVRGRRGE
jgi:hypothetical protein